MEMEVPMSTSLPASISPDLMAAKLFRQLQQARRNAANSREEANVKELEAVALEQHLETVEAEYRAAKAGCVL